MLPPAPARFSTTTDCPHASASFCASSRATTSVAPPAANGTTIFTGLAGQDCAATSAGNASASSAAAHRAQLRFFIGLSPVVVVPTSICLTCEREREPRGEREARRERGQRLVPVAPRQEFQREHAQAAGQVRGQRDHQQPFTGDD